MVVSCCGICECLVVPQSSFLSGVLKYMLRCVAFHITIPISHPICGFTFPDLEHAYFRSCGLMAPVCRSHIVLEVAQASSRKAPTSPSPVCSS